jgi:23S rRNA U2552 (ribose-2'-O)-methylase RlmE/FtsJ
MPKCNCKLKSGEACPYNAKSGSLFCGKHQSCSKENQIKKSPSPKPRSSSPKRKSLSPKRKSPSPCPSGKELNPKTGRCVTKCAPNQVRNEKGRCVKKSDSPKRKSPSSKRKSPSPKRKSPSPKRKSPCPSGKELNPKTGRCITKCAPNQVRNEKGRCVTKPVSPKRKSPSPKRRSPSPKRRSPVNQCLVPINEFFKTYDMKLLPIAFNKCDYSMLEEHQVQFLNRWIGEIPTLTISFNPVLKSRLVRPPILSLDKELLDAKLKMDEFHQFNKQKEDYYNKASRLLDPFLYYRREAENRVIPQKSLTNAWLKCWEMVHKFTLLPNHGSVKLFCNAELPGAFLFALNHFIATKTKLTYDWVANSLYPSEGHILGDEFGLYRQFPEKWLMSKEQNGDVTNPAIINHIAARCDRTIDLYTSDIGIELNHDTFKKQEEIEAPLHLGQILCALRTLKAGGNMVCKTFMFFHPFSISLLYLTSLCFTTFYIHKPETSRPHNSEVYVIGKGFKINEDVIRQLMHLLANWKPELINEYIVAVPEDFYLNIIRASYYIYERQMQFITRQIKKINYLYESNPNDPTTLIKEDVAKYMAKTRRGIMLYELERKDEWVQLFDIPPLKEKDSIFTIFKAKQQQRPQQPLPQQRPQQPLLQQRPQQPLLQQRPQHPLLQQRPQHPLLQQRPQHPHQQYQHPHHRPQHHHPIPQQHHQQYQHPHHQPQQSHQHPHHQPHQQSHQHPHHQPHQQSHQHPHHRPQQYHQHPHHRPQHSHNRPHLPFQPPPPPPLRVIPPLYAYDPSRPFVPMNSSPVIAPASPNLSPLIQDDREYVPVGKSPVYRPTSP